MVRSVTYGLAMSSVSRAPVDQLGDGVRDRPHGAGRVVEDHGRDGVRRCRPMVGEERGDVADAHAVTTEGRHGDELELGHDGSAQAQEEVVELAVAEVVLEARPDPAGAAVDYDQLAVVDVADAAKVEPERALGSDRPLTRDRLHAVVDHHVDACGDQTVEHRPRRAAGVAAVRVDTDPHRHARSGLPCKDVECPPAEPCRTIRQGASQTHEPSR